MKHVVLLLFLFIFADACPTCKMMQPLTDVSITLHVQKGSVKKIDFLWVFPEDFTQLVLLQYDTNSNQKFDKEELLNILEAKVDYLVPRKMLTSIHYTPNTKQKAIPFKAIKYYDPKVYIKNKVLCFSYHATVDIAIPKEASLSFRFADSEEFFVFQVKKMVVDGLDRPTTIEIKSNRVTAHFDSVVKKPIPLDTTQIEKEITADKNADASWQGTLVKRGIKEIKTLFQDIKEGENMLAYIFLLVFAYLYGLIHALGPGHGKSLVASYFLSYERSYNKALFVSLMIGVVHTFSAFLLTLGVYFLVNQFLGQVVEDAVFYTTKISAVIIIFIALHLLFKKFRVRKEMKKQSYTFSTTPHISTCGCAACKPESQGTDLALIISAGIVPCPGTITLFIFSFSLGLYTIGFISALVMSLGMSTIIFASAVISTFIRNKSKAGSGNAKLYLEFISMSIILLLGIFLLLS